MININVINETAQLESVIVGIANDRSLAWGIAEGVYKAGGKSALTYQNVALKKRILP